MKKVLNPKSILISLGFLIIATLLVLWFISFKQTNSKAYKQEVEIFEMGEWAALEDSFFIYADPSLDGYSVRVNSAELVKYSDYVIENGGQELMDTKRAEYTSDYLYLVNMTVKNEGNEEGGIQFLLTNLLCKSLNLNVDFSVWRLIDPNYTGSPGIMLYPDTEVTLTVPYSPMQYDIVANRDKVNKMMESEDFYLCLTYFPVRKLIEINLDD